MRAVFIRGLCLAFLTILIGVGCTSVSIPKRDRPDVALQLQNSVALAAGRFIMVIRAVEGGDLDKAKKDLDWWLDQSIIELQLLEELYPEGHWEAVPVQGTTDFQMRTLYERIAQFRRDHPRRHSVPLDAKSLRRIDAFVQKYQ